MATKIKHIKFTKTETFIGFVVSEQPRDANSIVNEKNLKRSDLPRHADFERAMDKMKPHLLIACGFQLPKDYNGNFLQQLHFDDFFSDTEEEAERFGGLELTSVIVHGKHAADGIQLFGTKIAPNGDSVPVKTPVIALKRVTDGYNYALIEIIDSQFDKLMGEAQLFHDRKKHGAGLQTTADLPPNKTAVNTKNSANMKKVEQDNLVDA
ncbi:MAG TPA: hypothetical protein VGN20_06470 [Mucilaginibacter sp.]|jgi:hypothetical protein